MLVDVQVFAPAKVNIGLRVLDKESSFEFNGDYKAAGFHCIESIFQTVSLCDEIDVSFMQTNKKNTVGIEAVDCIFDDASGKLQAEKKFVLPPENTISKVYDLFCQFTGLNEGVEVFLRKKIPAGGGLGGGSSDAASFLYALTKLHGIELTEELAEFVASKVGSDVFFFVHCLLNGGGMNAALVSGRGEIVKSILPRKDLFFVFIFPEVHSSTKEAYGLLDDSYMAGKYFSCPDFGEYESIYNGPVEKWSFVNNFTPVLVSKYPVIAEAISDMKKYGALWADMSGSGSVVFGVFNNENSAEACVRELSKLTCNADSNHSFSTSVVCGAGELSLNLRRKWKKCVLAH